MAKVSVAPGQVTEGSDATFTIFLSATTVQSITINYFMGGTAKQGVDYTMSGTPGHVTIPAGQTSTTLTLHSIADHVAERSETASVVLTTGFGYKLPKRPKAVVTIANGP